MKLVTLAICQEFLFSKRCVKEAAVAALCMLELNLDQEMTYFFVL